MLDIFFTDDLRALVKNKSIVFMGDSNMRALYKDFLCLLTQNKLILQSTLQRKMENSVFGDKLKNHGERTNGRTYREEREFEGNEVQVSFYFLTRVYNEYVKMILQKITSNKKPDLLIINSCLWDVTRWGAEGATEFQLNLTHLLKQLKLHLPDCLVIWLTTPPISQGVKGGFLVQELQFLKYSLRFHVVEANHFARKVVVENGFDVVDSHYHLKLQLHRRAKDGIHWLPPSVRYVINLLLTHISLAWNIPLPHRYNSSIMAENLESLDAEVSTKAPVQKNKVQAKEKTQEDRVALKAQCMAARSDKENLDAPTPKREKKERQRAKKSRGGASHHAFLNRAQHKERINRVRQWQKVPVSNHSPNPGYLSPPDSHHDSGYFPSPNEAYLSNESVHSNQRNITYSSPQSSRTVNYFGPHATQSPWRPPLPREMHYSPLPPLPSEPYPYSPIAQFGIGRTLLQGPYIFPHVLQGHTFHPRMDFTSDDFQAF